MWKKLVLSRASTDLVQVTRNDSNYVEEVPDDEHLEPGEVSEPTVIDIVAPLPKRSPRGPRGGFLPKGAKRPRAISTVEDFEAVQRKRHRERSPVSRGAKRDRSAFELPPVASTSRVPATSGPLPTRNIFQSIGRSESLWHSDRCPGGCGQSYTYCNCRHVRARRR
ncbi:hypothetical protein M378DRAFT_182751 [Amanita muscaria Koide BX008]|uniref:Uncharacterized protein n=1 Tax=Amanita muscaria (strain Koide BX008) TaxID=946122 RepID=A0A0C2SIJ4_AMAMK|nr:hypothetical protein M378DRAFT_182751 [Amanita muscaria Koide BX008]